MSWYDEQVHYARVITYSNDLGSTSEGSIEKGEQELINQSMRTIYKIFRPNPHQRLSVFIGVMVLRIFQTLE